MATARLNDDERQNISNAITRIIQRALHNKEFPVPKEEVTEWITNQLPKPIREAYRLLRADAPDLVIQQSYSCDFDICSDTYKYRIGISQPVPTNNIMVLTTAKYHAAVIEWVEWEVKTKNQSEDAESYIETLVWSCTSSGQLKRLLPQEVMRFIPNYLLDFSQVERRSRIPNGFKPDTDRMENMLYMLTVGAISPEHCKGMAATSDYVTLIAEDD